MVVVVSAMGKSTDELIKMAYSISDAPPRRELGYAVSYRRTGFYFHAVHGP